MEEITDYGKQTGGRTVNEAEDVISKGHPPIADKVVLVDFDGTLYPFGYLFDWPPPIKGAAGFLKFLHSQGYKITIFTSRLSKTWLKSVNQTAAEHIKYIKDICKRDGISIAGITSEKIPCEFMIDDKAVPFFGNWDNTLIWYASKFRRNDAT